MITIRVAKAENYKVQTEEQKVQAEKDRIQAEEKLAEERAMMRERAELGFQNEMKDADTSTVK